MADSIRDQLLELLKQKAYTPGTVTLASGKTSDFYIDCRKVAFSGQGHQLIGEGFLKQLNALEDELKVSFTGCAGMALGAVPLTSALALTAYQAGRDLSAVVVRKEAKDHGAGQQIEGATEFKPGDKLILLEDVVTSGGSALKAVVALREAGFIIEHALCLVDREEGGTERMAESGLTLYPLFKRSDFLTA